MEMKKPGWSVAVPSGLKTALALALLQVVLAWPNPTLAQAAKAGQSCDDTDFPKTLCSFVPHDIDRKLKDYEALKVECPSSCDDPREPVATCLMRAECTQQGQKEWKRECVSPLQDKDLEVLDSTQRLYDIFSWKSFIAINWPMGEKGNPEPGLSAQAANPPTNGAMPQWKPRWLQWSTSQTLFPDPEAPTKGKQEIEFLKAKPAQASTALGTLRYLSFALLRPEGTSLNSSSQGLPLVRRMNGCGATMVAPLWDQNGQMVYYQTRINAASRKYIEENNANTLEGQIAIAGKYVFEFPYGVYYIDGKRSWAPEDEGAIEIKLAWKVIDESKGDIRERFFTMETEVPWKDGRSEKKILGLVGMHIAHKAQTSSQWIWSTFEHVDNVRVDPAEVASYRSQGKRLRPSFNDPGCKDCPVNQPPCGQDQEIPGGASAGGRLCKTQVERVLPIARSTEALNAQARKALKARGLVWQYYELVGTQWARQPGRLNANGVPTPRYLTNTMFETYNQKASCIDCHSHAFMATGWDEERKEYKTGPSDFSWLLTRARWKTNR